MGPISNRICSFFLPPFAVSPPRLHRNFACCLLVLAWLPALLGPASLFLRLEIVLFSLRSGSCCRQGHYINNQNKQKQGTVYVYIASQFCLSVLLLYSRTHTEPLTVSLACPASDPPPSFLPSFLRPLHRRQPLWLPLPLRRRRCGGRRAPARHGAKGG